MTNRLPYSEDDYARFLRGNAEMEFFCNGVKYGTMRDPDGKRCLYVYDDATSFRAYDIAEDALDDFMIGDRPLRAAIPDIQIDVFYG